MPATEIIRNLVIKDKYKTERIIVTTILHIIPIRILVA